MADTLGSFLGEAAVVLSSAGVDEPRRHARRLLGGLLDLSAAELLSNSRRGLEPHQADRLRRALGRMIEGEPLSRVLGRREFWGLNFALSEDTLDPRPESETLVEAVLARITDRTARLSFLDLGTGTGCLLLALLTEFPAAIGFGCDISTGAILTARRNAGVLGLADRALFFVGDWGSAVTGQFEAIVANPPYIGAKELAALPAQVRCYDPRRALDGGEDGLDSYRVIASDLPGLLAPGGISTVEIGIGQAGAATAIFAARGFNIDGIEGDLAGIERCVVLRLGESARAEPCSGGQKNLGICRHPV